MKKLITIFLIAFSLTAAAQKDTTVTDSTLIISINDLKDFDQWMYKNLTGEQRDKIVPYINALIQEAKRRKKTKQK
jgi:hypothetical protein